MSAEAPSVGRARTAAAVIFGLTIGQLLLATFATGLTQFAGKNFAIRLVAYPVLMLVVPAYYRLREIRRRRRGLPARPLPCGSREQTPGTQGSGQRQWWHRRRRRPRRSVSRGSRPTSGA